MNNMIDLNNMGKLMGKYDYNYLRIDVIKNLYV